MRWVLVASHFQTATRLARAWTLRIVWVVGVVMSGLLLLAVVARTRLFMLVLRAGRSMCMDVRVLLLLVVWDLICHMGGWTRLRRGSSMLLLWRMDLLLLLLLREVVGVWMRAAVRAIGWVGQVVLWWWVMVGVRWLLRGLLQRRRRLLRKKLLLGIGIDVVETARLRQARVDLSIHVASTCLPVAAIWLGMSVTRTRRKMIPDLRRAPGVNLSELCGISRDYQTHVRGAILDYMNGIPRTHQSASNALYFNAEQRPYERVTTC